jgi:protein tyrosine/serine phosphatase
MKYILALMLSAGLICFGQEIRVRPTNWAQPVMGVSLGNFYQVSTNLYRSEQPTGKELKMLETMGIKSILNLRGHHADDKNAVKNGITLYQVKMRAGSMDEESVKKALAILRTAPKPVLVHCWHGSDRTGLVVALYRITEQNWTREQAIDELEHGGFGYHEKLFPNIVEFIQKVDLNSLKTNEIEQTNSGGKLH